MSEMSADEREIREGMRFAPGVVQGHWVTQLLILLDEARERADHEKANREECIRKKRNEHERTKEIAALSKKAGWEAGAADMRERAVAAIAALWKERKDIRVNLWRTLRRCADAVRELPLTAPSAGPTSEAAALAVRPPAVGPRADAAASGAAPEPSGAPTEYSDTDSEEFG